MLRAVSENAEISSIENLIKSYGVLATDKHGATALHVAAQGDNVEAIELLLKHGAKVDAKDKRGNLVNWIQNQRSRSNATPLCSTIWKCRCNEIFDFQGSSSQRQVQLGLNLIDCVDLTLANLPYSIVSLSFSSFLIPMPKRLIT